MIKNKSVIADYTGITQVHFSMNISGEATAAKNQEDKKCYEVDCKFIPANSAIEVCASGESSSNDSCDFSVRRMYHRAKNLHELLMDTINQD